MFLDQVPYCRGFCCNVISDDANSPTRQCALLMMMSSMFGTEQRIIKRPARAKLDAIHVRPKSFGAEHVSIFATDR